jgi:hypothetical protein
MRMEKTPTASFSIVEWREDILKKKNKNRVSDTIKWRHRWNRRAKFPVCAAHIVAGIWRKKKCYNKEKKKARDDHNDCQSRLCAVDYRSRGETTSPSPSLPFCDKTPGPTAAWNNTSSQKRSRKKRETFRRHEVHRAIKLKSRFAPSFYFLETTDHSYTVFSKRTG